jgi:hypothetical protein
VLCDTEHEEDVVSCGRGCCASFAEHVRSIAIAPSVYNSNVSKQNAYDKSLSADRDAYKRMRDEGLRPAHLKGAATLENRASSEFEITSGRVQPEHIAKRLDAAVTEAAQAKAAA